MLRPFQTTIWTSIRLARDGKSTALNDFVMKYRQPVLSFIRRQGYTEEDAEDLCQEVFLLMLKENLLSHAERARGRLRNFLLGVVKNVLRNAERSRDALKRGGGKAPTSLETSIGDDAKLGDLVAAESPDETFDQDWIHHLIQVALESLRQGHPRLHEALALNLDRKLTYAEIARDLGLEHKQVDNLLQQARSKLAGLIRDEIATYCGSPGAFQDEIACLKRYLVPARTPVDLP